MAQNSTTATAHQSRNVSAGQSGQADLQDLRQPLEDLVQYARDYARQQPEMAALWCLGAGFILGWKFRAW